MRATKSAHFLLVPGSTASLHTLPGLSPSLSCTIDVSSLISHVAGPPLPASPPATLNYTWRQLQHVGNNALALLAAPADIVILDGRLRQDVQRRTSRMVTPSATSAPMASVASLMHLALPSLSPVAQLHLPLPSVPCPLQAQCPRLRPQLHSSFAIPCRRRTLAQIAAARGGLPFLRELCAATKRSPTLSHGVTSQSAAHFEFPGGGSSGGIGWPYLLQALRRSRSDGAPLAVEGWAQEQFRWIVWKLACQQRCFSSSALPPASDFTAVAVLWQLQRRYEREHVQRARSVLRRISNVMDNDRDVSLVGAHMLLCVAGVELERRAIELTDGWCSVWAVCDPPLAAQLRRRRLVVGLKLRLRGLTEHKAHEDLGNEVNPGIPLLPCVLTRSATAPCFELHSNSTRRASWDAKLGLCERASFRVNIDSLQCRGGRAPSLRVLIARVFGPLVLVKAEAGSMWQTVSQAMADDEGWRTRAVERNQQKARHREASGDHEPHESEPPRRWLVYRLVLVDLLDMSLQSGADSRDATLPQTRATLPSTPALLSLWQDYAGEGGDEGFMRPEEGDTGWVHSANVTSASVSSPVFFGASKRAVQLDLPRGQGWQPDPPRRVGTVSNQMSLCDTIPRRSYRGDGAASVVSGSTAGVLVAHGVARVHTPIASLQFATAGLAFDSVAYLLAVSATKEAMPSWGAPKECRDLVFADASLNLLFVRWVRPPDDTLPRLRVGSIVCLLEMRYEYTLEMPRPAELPPALQGFGVEGICVRHALAESIGPMPARLLPDINASGTPTAHLYDAFMELSQSADALRDTLALLSGLVLDLVNGRVHASTRTVPLVATNPQIANQGHVDGPRVAYQRALPTAVLPLRTEPFSDILEIAKPAARYPGQLVLEAAVQRHIGNAANGLTKAELYELRLADSTLVESLGRICDHSFSLPDAVGQMLLELESTFRLYKNGSRFLLL